MDPSLAIALSVFIISYGLLASERINRTVVVAIAFLVVVSPQSDKGETSADRPAYLHGEGRRFNRPSPSLLYFF